MTEQQQQLKVVLVLSNNTNKEGRRKKDERPDEICDATKQFNRKIVRSKLKWAGHMVRMDADILVKRVEEKGEKHQGCKKRGTNS